MLEITGIENLDEIIEDYKIDLEEYEEKKIKWAKYYKKRMSREFKDMIEDYGMEWCSYYHYKPKKEPLPYYQYYFKYLLNN